MKINFRQVMYDLYGDPVPRQPPNTDGKRHPVCKHCGADGSLILPPEEDFTAERAVNDVLSQLDKEVDKLSKLDRYLLATKIIQAPVDGIELTDVEITAIKSLVDHYGPVIVGNVDIVLRGEVISEPGEVVSLTPVANE